VLRRYPITTFFSLTLVISWGVWFSLLLVPESNGSTRFLLTIIGSFGPALSAFIVSATLHPESSGIPTARRWVAWTIATSATFPFVVSWSFLAGHPKDLMFYALSLVLSGLAGLVIASVWSNRVGVRDLMASLAMWRVSPTWFVYALLAWPVFYVLVNSVAVLLDGASMSDYFAQYSSIAVSTAIVIFITTTLVGAPLQEEPGWRAFAQTRLQVSHSPLVASIVLGLIWQIWHLPLYAVGLYAFSWSDIASRLITFLPGALIYAWLWNRSRGSLLILVLFHAGNDAFPQIIPSAGASSENVINVAIFLWGAVLLVMDRMWRRLPADEMSPSSA
jgi:membrane protease YdiL (CAAX protease family)